MARVRPAAEQDWPAIESLLKTKGLHLAGARRPLQADVVAMAKRAQKDERVSPVKD